MLNNDQVRYWNGPAGQNWASAQARIAEAFREVTEAYLADLPLQGGDVVLDVGCGAGDLAIAVASRIGPAGRILAVDISEPLLAVARARVADLPRNFATVEVRTADAAQLSEASAFDLIVSRFGVMFFPDPVEAFRRLRRTLKPHGRLAVLCWRNLGENDWARIPFEVMREVTGRPEALPTEGPGPFSFADSETVTEILIRAGFDEISAAPIEAVIAMGANLEEAGHYAATQTPASRLLAEAEPEMREEAVRRVTQALRPFETPNGIHIGAACWLYEGRSPG